MPPTPRRSPRTTRGEAELPLLPLDIKVVKIGVAHLRGLKRSAEHIDEAANEDKGEGSEPGPRNVVTPVGRRVRFQTKATPESLLKQRRRVGDTAEAAPDELWVAVGEDRCKPCKLVGREVCEPQWNGNEPCKSCVFCIDQTWSCNPPESWVEKAASKPHPKRPPPNSQVATDDAPSGAGGSSKTAEAAPSTTNKVARGKRQSKRQKGIKLAQAALYREDRNRRLRILERLEALEVGSNTTLCLLMALCRHHGIIPERIPGINDLPPRRHLHGPARVTTELAAHSPIPRNADVNSRVGDEDEEPSQEVQGNTLQTSNNRQNLAARLEELQGRMDYFEERMKGVDHRLNDAGL